MLAAAPASATVPGSSHFVFSGAGGNPVWRKTLHQPYWAMQSFAYDHFNGHLYIAQGKPGSDTGDVWMNKTDLHGNVLGTMALHGFGHASSMCVEPVSGAVPFLWLEGDSVRGAGRRLARFRYRDGGTLDYGSSSIYDRTPTISSYRDLPRPAIDPYTNRLLIRYATATSESREWRIVLFSLADAVNGNLGDGNRLIERAIPNNDELGLSDSHLFQGITAYGQYAYLLYGGSGTASYLVRLDMNKTGGSYEEKFLTNAGQSLPGREPEGIAIWRDSSGPRLAFGFSAKVSGSPATFDSSIFYKSELTN
ncbi:phage baseplate protein [Streptomyces sp. NPDC054841]